MKRLCLILGDQLSLSLASIQAIDRQQDHILLCEVFEEATYVRHHQKKIAFIFSAMRHFAESLRTKGYRVHYTKINDTNNTGSLVGEVARHIATGTYDEIVVTHPGEYRLYKEMTTWHTSLKTPVCILDDDRFLATLDEFKQWAQGRKQLRMEYFYREMRQKHHILMQGKQPKGGKWNFDAENRQPPTADLIVPKPLKVNPDAITQEVLKTVQKAFGHHFGTLDDFHFAVTRQSALKVLRHFITYRLKQFGDYQDAMVQGEVWMFHAHISFYLNCGLLLPRECIEAAEQAYQQGLVKINAAEGFIRQILGWREYVRGFYWLHMPNYAKENFFEATGRLPQLYWDGKTKMNCLHQCVQDTQKNAYAHHIQRLMVLGNFALLTGVHPKYVNHWFLVVYADAYEWVEMPNVTGMALFADGGILASKPYAAGGGYIHKMSNYCSNCHYKVKEKEGPSACPFNYLYWHFLASHRKKLQKNPRISMMYRTYDRMDAAKKKRIKQESTQFILSLKI